MRSFCTSAPAVRNSPPAGTVPAFQLFAPVVEPLPVGRFAGFHPGLAEQHVLRRLEGCIIVLGLFPAPGDVGQLVQPTGE